MRTIDCVTYNGESELFEIRYNILKDYVDEFIVVEFDKTFSGKSKQQTFTQHWPKVKYCWHNDGIYNKYMDLAQSSPNTQGASHWKTEFCQKESIKDALTHLQDDDIVFIGDCDEVWNPKDLPYLLRATQFNAQTLKLKLRVYTYFLNNRSNERFYGTVVAKWGVLKDKCLNHIRSTMENRTRSYYGWHFTSLHHQVFKKLTDSYTAESYATPMVLLKLDENVCQNKDFLGRPFTFKITEGSWPPWLKEHRQNYQHLLK